MIVTIVFLLLSLMGLIIACCMAVKGISRLVHFFANGYQAIGWTNLRVWALVLCFVCVGALSIAVLTQMMAATPVIEDANGNAVEGSLSELIKVNVNGREEWISLRGHDQNAPILLFLAGGPGGSQMAAVRHDLAELEKYFIVVNWDQPGSGKSFKAAPSNEITIETYIEDGCALAQYLCERFGKESIFLLGESWGSALGIFMIDREPERFSAFVGTGQMVDFVATEVADYELALKLAEEKNDEKKVKKLKENGLPPYDGKDVTWKSAEYLSYLGNIMANNPNIENAGYNTLRDVFSSEYGVIDKINYFRGITTTFNTTYPQLYGIDLKDDFAQLDVPVAFFLGRHDINAPTYIAEEYYDRLNAPTKELVWFEHSGHSPWINESELFVQELLLFAGIEKD